MPLERDEKARLVEELKHYINGKFAELEKKLFSKPEKAKKETATKG